MKRCRILFGRKNLKNRTFAVNRIKEWTNEKVIFFRMDWTLFWLRSLRTLRSPKTSKARALNSTIVNYLMHPLLYLFPKP